jgi:hypothetical protein
MVHHVTPLTVLFIMYQASSCNIYNQFVCERFLNSHVILYLHLGSQEKGKRTSGYGGRAKPKRKGMCLMIS